MAGTWDVERQRTEEFREEQLDWLHQQHAQMSRQTRLLEEIAKHTRLFYALAVLWLVLTVMGVIVLAVQNGA